MYKTFFYLTNYQTLAAPGVPSFFFTYLFNALAKHDRYLINQNRSNNLTFCHWLCTGQSDRLDHTNIHSFPFNI